MSKSHRADAGYASYLVSPSVGFRLQMASLRFWKRDVAWRRGHAKGMLRAIRQERRALEAYLRATNGL